MIPGRRFTDAEPASCNAEVSKQAVEELSAMEAKYCRSDS